MYLPTCHRITTTSNSRPFAVREIDEALTIYKSLDDQSDDLLYRDQKVFATGHGTAVTWDDISTEGKHAGILKTTTLPFYEVPRVNPTTVGQGRKFKYENTR